MRCRHCGYQNEDVAIYCAKCGKKLSKSTGGKRFPYLPAVLILAVGVLTGALLFGEKEKPAVQPSGDWQMTVQEAAPIEETTLNRDPLVLAYSEHTDSAPANYYYNEAGQLVRKVQDQWDQVTEYTYHPNGALKEETVIRSGSSYCVTEFDNYGNPSAEYSGGELIYSYANQYDDQGRLILCTKTDDGERKEIFRYTYREDGWYEEEYTYITFSNGEELVHDQVWRCYSPEGVLAHESWEVADYLPGNRGTIYTLDDHGNVVMESYQAWTDTTSQRDDTYYEHTYNSQGLVTKTEVTYCGYLMSSEYGNSPDFGYNTDMTLKEIITYTYDSEGRMTGKKIQNVEGDFTIENVWEYDAQGNLTRFSGVPENSNSWYVEEIRQYQPLSKVLVSD